jgi:hypothetical protein
METATMARVNSSGLEDNFRCKELLVALTFAAALGTLAISLFWPYMIPFTITTERVTAPHSSLTLIFWGGGAFVLPFMLLRTAINYTVFRGKSRPRETGSNLCAAISGAIEQTDEVKAKLRGSRRTSSWTSSTPVFGADRRQ